MKKKASLTLSEEVLRAVDELAGERGRSALVEEAVRHYLRARAKEAVYERDVELLDRQAEAFNAVAEDVLEYQAYWDALRGETT